MNTDVYLIVAIIIVGFGILGWFISRRIQSMSSSDLDEQKTKDIVNQVFGEVSQKVISQAKASLEADKEAIYKDNSNKKDAIEKLVNDLKKEIDNRQNEIRELEKDRNKKFGDLSRSLLEHRKITDELNTSTQALGRILSNNQARGQWGERIIEEILTSGGLIETIHYDKQKTLGKSSLKPDITLLLPEGRKVAVDVKFPYSEIQQMSSATSPSAKAQHLKKFERDVKTKIKQITKYINVEEGTLDYAIMFVPNEMLFSFINQQFPQIIDEAMSSKVMIVSPFTFLIVARTIMESYRNFMVENNLRKIIKYISEFIGEWSRFISEFDKFDDNILKLRASFDKIHDVRYKRMALRIKRIENYRQGDVLKSTSTKQLKK